MKSKIHTQLILNRYFISKEIFELFEELATLSLSLLICTMSLRNICDIVVFHTPLDTNESMFVRTKIVDGYLSGMGISWKTHGDVTHATQTILSEFQGTIFTISFSSSIGLIPSIRVSLMPATELPKVVIESLLSDIVRIFRGQFSGRYFLEYDPIYHLDEMNMGKKYDLADIA